MAESLADNLDEILSMARSLGEAIARHPRYAALRAADARVRADKTATDALDAYNRAAATIARKEQNLQPVEVEEKRNLDRLRQAVAGNETIKAFMRAQADYAELMRRMNDAIYRAITEQVERPGAGGAAGAGM